MVSNDATRRQFLSSAVCFVYEVAVDRSCQTEAAGNGEDLTGGIGRSIAGKIAHSFRNLLGHTHTGQGNVSYEQISKIVSVKRLFVVFSRGNISAIAGNLKQMQFIYIHGLHMTISAIWVMALWPL